MAAEAKYTMQEQASARRYGLEFGGAMALYALLMLTVVPLAKRMPEWRIAFALMPALPLVFALVAVLRFLRRMDELQRQLQYEAIAFAFAAGLMLSMTWGLLESVADLPRLSWSWVPPLFITLWGIGGVIAHRRVR